ncbi:MAG: hypothetical protein AABZ31_10050 [Bdellovibrionota bacterium]
MKWCLRIFSLLALALTLSACQGETSPSIQFDEPDHTDEHLDDGEQLIDEITQVNCKKATASQVAVVNQGNKFAQEFMAACYANTENSPMCLELIRPNPLAKSTFACTYGASQVHQLIHPDRNTWKNAFKAVWLIKQLQAKNIKICQIYNWWRPEPYNVNVGGAAGRHPFGTSVDVNFCNKAEQEKAHAELCKLRKQGHLRALGHYPGTGLHFGVGDSTANTWGKGCPS